MTLQECLSITDEMKPNMMSRKLKIKYLTEIEQLIYNEIILNHYPERPAPPAGGTGEPPWWPQPIPVGPEGHPVPPDPEPAPKYTEDTDPGTVLLVPDVYANVYTYWLMTKIDMQNQEDARYNIDRAYFENAYDTFSDYYTRTHMPVQRTREFRL